MASIHINRGGTNLGIFSEAEVREGLGSGRFLATDLGWREGMAAWQTLGQFPEFAAGAAPTATASATPAPGGPVAPLPAAPSGTPVNRTGLPWDRRHELGLVNAFIETLKMVLGQPTLAFSSMKTEGGLAEPLIYALIGGSFGCIIYLLFTIAMSSFGIMGANRNNAFAGLLGMGFGTVFTIILIPLFLAASFFLSAAIIHLCLVMVGGARRSFETTFRVVCFSAGSVHPLMVIPFCGGLVAGVWGLVVECIGLARAHETETGRAVLAVCLPLILCCGGGFLLAMMFGIIGAMTGHH